MFINSLVIVIPLVHIYIFIFEAFLWESQGPKVFINFPVELFPKTKALAFNQGVYNLFLAVRLYMTYFIDNTLFQAQGLLFFLVCVFVAGPAGALTEIKDFTSTIPACTYGDFINRAWLNL